MPQQLPSGNWRARIRHPRTGKQLNPQAIIGGPASYETHEQAEAAEHEARTLLEQNARAGVTLREFWQEWTTDPVWSRSEQTDLHNRERTAKFVDRHGDKPIRAIDDLVAADWIRDNRSTVPALRAMFNDAKRAQAGRLVVHNPFAGLRLPQSRGRKDTQPPAQEQLARMVQLADELTPPSFAAYLHTLAHSGARPGEWDALKLTDLDFQAGTIRVERQWNAKLRKLTLPKHGHARTIALTDPVRERLLALPRESEWVFTTLRGTHYTPSSRSPHWNRVRCSAGLGQMDLYTASRHYFAWYALNVLEVDEKWIALQLGHRDGGELVRTTYGHPDAVIARRKIREAFAAAPAARCRSLSKRRPRRDRPRRTRRCLQRRSPLRHRRPGRRRRHIPRLSGQRSPGGRPHGHRNRDRVR
jgi:integrase